MIVFPDLKYNKIYDLSTTFLAYHCEVVEKSKREERNEDCCFDVRPPS